jgi:transcriptional regulator with XRE-family HTH domain
MLSMEEPDIQSAAAITRTIGRRVRQGRNDRGWTLDQLAKRSGVSRRMLVNVEQGVTNPSITTLLRLADALGIGLPTLVETSVGDIGNPVAVTRAGAALAMWTSTGGGSAVMVASTTTPDAYELWDWHLGPGDDYRSEAHHPGTRELLLVGSGSIELEVGDSVHRLKAGDAAAFDGNHPHAYRNASKSRPARFTLTVYDPAPTKEP